MAGRYQFDVSVYNRKGVVLLWVSYSSMIVFYGAEFTYAYANMNSGKVAPSEIAIAEIPSKPS